MRSQNRSSITPVRFRMKVAGVQTIIQKIIIDRSVWSMTDNCKEMKCCPDGCTTTASRTWRLSKFAKIQMCLFFCCAPHETISTKPSLRRRTEKLSKVFMKEPSYEEQSWVFEAIKMRPAWNMGYSGENIRVRINDEGWGHFFANTIREDRLIRNSNSSEYDFSCGDPSNDIEVPLQWKAEYTNNSTKTLKHGPAVTSILAANGTDGFCGVGIAPRSKLSFCNFQEGITDAGVLMHNVNSQSQNSETSNISTSIDISINAFSYSGCSSKSREMMSGIHLKKNPNNVDTLGDENDASNRNKSSRLLESSSRMLESCPFTLFDTDGDKSSQGPCQVCTKKDFDFMDSDKNRDNVFEPRMNAATKLSGNGNGEDKTSSETNGYNVGVSESCASSVRSYCLHNFRRDEALCTKWIEVINNGNVCSYKSNVGTKTQHSLETGVKEGRNGKGVIYIFSSGDSYGSGDNVNFQAFPKSRFAMTVGAVKMRTYAGQTGSYHKPIHSTYSTGGSSLFVVAPGGDYDSPHQYLGGGGETNCGEIGYGTGFAAPVVGGVVALMLEAYKNATWRDVRAIIAEASKPVENLDVNGNNDDATFGINAAGYGYSDLYGFGLINARWAVQKAKNWNRKQKHTPPEISLTRRSGELNLDVYDDSFSTTTSTIMLFSDEVENDFSYVESVSVYLKLRYFNR